MYEDLLDFKALKTLMENQLEDYNMEPGIISMDLVLFKDAIEHGMFDFCSFSCVFIVFFDFTLLNGLFRLAG